MTDKASKPIRVSDDAHARLRIFKERYGVNAFSDVIVMLTRAVDGDIDQTVDRFMDWERKTEAERKRLADG